jgi:hypothetical protein
VINAIVIVIVGNLCIVILMEIYALATPAPAKIEQKIKVLKIMV